MGERQCNKAPVRYNFQVVLEDEDDDEVHALLMDSWIYLNIESDEESSDEENEEQFVQKDQHVENLSNIGEKSCDEIQVTQAESLPAVLSSHASEIIPYAFTTGEIHVMEGESLPVVCLPHSSLTVFRASTTGKTQLIQDESPRVLSSLHVSQTLPCISTSGETQVTQDELTPLVLSPHTSHTLPLASTSGESQVTKAELTPLVLLMNTAQTLPLAPTTQQSQVTQDKPPQMVSLTHASHTLPHASTSGESLGTQDELPPPVLSPHTSRILPHASTSGKSKMTWGEPSQRLLLPHKSQIFPYASSLTVNQEIQTSSRVNQETQISSRVGHETQTKSLHTLPYTSSSRKGQETSAKLPHTSQTLPRASSSRLGQESWPQSPHTSNILTKSVADVSTSGKGQIKCHSSQTIPNPQDSDVQRGLYVQWTVGGYKSEKKYHAETSHNDISSKTVGLGSTTETIRHCADISQQKMVDDSGTPQKNPSVIHSSETIGVADALHTVDAKTDFSLASVHTGTPSVAIHDLKVKNINKSHTNASKSILSEGIESPRDSVVSSSVVNAKRKLPDDETVICISDDEPVSDSDVVCLESCKYSKPLYVCKSENSSHKRAVPVEENYICRDITVIKDMKSSFRSRKTRKRAMASTSNKKPDIIIEKVINPKFNSDVVHALSPSTRSINRCKKKRKVSRNLFVNCKKSEKESSIYVEKEIVKDVLVL